MKVKHFQFLFFLLLASCSSHRHTSSEVKEGFNPPNLAEENYLRRNISHNCSVSLADPERKTPPYNNTNGDPALLYQQVRFP